MKTVRVGVLGAWRGMGYVRVAQHHPQLEVGAICDGNADRLAEAGKTAGPDVQLLTDYDQLVRAGVDVVVVAGYCPDHADQSIQAMDAGKHVLSEITACHTFEQGRRLCEAVERTGLKYMMAENCCFWAFIEAWRDIVASGRLGEVVYAEAEYVHDIGSMGYDAQGRETWRLRYPPIHYLTHSLGPLMTISGQRGTSVVCHHTGPTQTGIDGVTDAQVALIKTDRGRVFKILCNFRNRRFGCSHWYCVYGTRGTLENARRGGGRPDHEDEGTTYADFDDTPHARGMVRMPLSVNHSGLPAGATAGGHGTCEYVMIDAYIRSILDDTKPPIDVYESMDQTLPGIAAEVSSRDDGRPYRVPDFRDPDQRCDAPQRL